MRRGRIGENFFLAQCRVDRIVGQLQKNFVLLAGKFVLRKFLRGSFRRNRGRIRWRERHRDRLRAARVAACGGGLGRRRGGGGAEPYLPAVECRPARPGPARSGCRCRGPGGRDARRVRPAAADHDRDAERDPRGSLPASRGCVLLLPVGQGRAGQGDRRDPAGQLGRAGRADPGPRRRGGGARRGVRDPGLLPALLRARPQRRPSVRRSDDALEVLRAEVRELEQVAEQLARALGDDHAVGLGDPL